MKVRKFENIDQVNNHLRTVNLNTIAEKYGKITSGGLHQFDSLGLQLFVSAVLKEAMLEEGEESNSAAG